MAEIPNYETLAPANSAAPPDGFPENTLGRQYRPIVQELMARTRRWFDSVSGSLKATGSNGNYVVSPAMAAELARGFPVVFRANHENPAAAPTLAVGSSGQRPLVYADGSTIPTGGIKSGQLIQAYADNDTGSWRTSLVPASASVAVVTGDKLSLSGQATGAVSVYSGSAWVATGVGTSSQVLRGGPNPGFGAVPFTAGMALLACRISAGVVATNRDGLPHTATVSRLGVGRYRLNITPALPSGYMAFASLYNEDLSVVGLVTFRLRTTTTIELSRNARSDGAAVDLAGSETIDILVI